MLPEFDFLEVKNNPNSPCGPWEIRRSVLFGKASSFSGKKVARKL
jgi:hypothetical protein